MALLRVFVPCVHRATRGYAAASASLTKKTPVSAKGNSKVQDPNKLKSLTITEEQTKELDRMLVMAQLMPTVDPWGQQVQDTLGGSLRLLSQLFINFSLLSGTRRHDTLQCQLQILHSRNLQTD